jgi:aminoacrylate peracid reductase
MPMTAIFPPGAGKPMAPYSPGVRADNVVYVSGALPLNKDTNSCTPVTPRRRPGTCSRPSRP